MTRIAEAWRRVPTVSAKVLLILMPGTMVMAALVLAVALHGRQRDLEAALREKMAAIADVNAATLSSTSWTFDLRSVGTLVQAIGGIRDVVCVEVSDERSGDRVSWPGAGCPPDAGAAVERRPIRIHDLQVGTVALYYSRDAVDEHLRRDAAAGTLLLLLMLAGTAAAALAALRLAVGRPLHRLIASIREAERDSADERPHRPVDWRAADELGRVIEAHNAMAARLWQEETALRKSEERLALAITATRSSVWDYNLGNGQYWWSKEFPALLGYGPDELAMTAETWASLLHPEERERVIAASRRRLRDQARDYAAVYRMRRRDGRWAWIEDRATARRGADGRALRLTGTMSDVTERVRAELDLARERNILQVTLDNTDQGILKVDGDGRVVMANRRAAELLNIPQELLVGNPLFAEVVALQQRRGEFGEFGDDPDLFLSYGGGQEGTGGPPDEPSGAIDQPFTFKRRRPDGRIVEVRTNPLPEGGFVRTLTDVTVEARSAEEIFTAMQELERAYAELKETQASLVQAEKMASLALLVAGVAHEINTPIGIAFGCATHLSGRTGVLSDAFEHGTMKRSDLAAYVATAGDSARLIEQNLTRAAELIQSFKRVAVDQTSQERRCFELLAYLEEVVTSLGPTLRKSRHRIAIACSPGIMMDSLPGALSQVVTNLVMNSLTHAFPSGSSGHMVIDVDEMPDGDVEIRFADDGIGIPPENLPKVFEPFFTTRRGSGGSGLGLHIVFNLVTQSLGGRISVDSVPGDGTTFTLRVPKTATPNAAAPDTAKPDTATPHTGVPRPPGRPDDRPPDPLETEPA
ncbi:PAS domain-containing sensor histidine kinase [Azospirillum picis]|uniref:histidine kinase n=1 Tax=Azospirillum picis TaxID=488438 RepID=A0ABU0MF83_9PROT|nr:ATP-binding protein [Azospirillum picis]MBP2298249.1 PAS domain S-box-containing protein [Azospirillum picis]MDQ0532086.1 PAS domain S-box-containing protein [Azospirillum picis]